MIISFAKKNKIKSKNLENLNHYQVYIISYQYLIPLSLYMLGDRLLGLSFFIISKYHLLFFGNAKTSLESFRIILEFQNL